MTEIMIKKKNVVMDATILSSLMSCERLTDFRFNHNLVPIGGKGNPLEVGSLMHKMLESYYKTIRDTGKRDVDKALEAGHEFILNGDDGNGTTIPVDNEKHKNGQIKNVGWKHAIYTFEQYCDFYRNDSWEPIEVEKVLGTIIYEDDEMRLLWKAKLDLMVDTNQGIYPVDHKTMKQNRDTLKLNNQFMGQCVLNKSRTMFINKIGFQLTAKPEEKFLRVAMSYTADALVEWLETAAYYGKYLISLNETGYYPPRFSHCDKYNGCIFRSICESDRGMRAEELRMKFKVGEPWDIDDE